MVKKVLTLVALGFVLVAAAPSTPNNGTVKVHVSGTSGDTTPVTRNNPHVGCSFHVHGTNFSADTTWTVTSWPPTGNRTVVLTGKGPISPNYSLANGHYRLDSVNPTKHKMFWVDCDSNSPQPTPTGSVSSIELPDTSTTNSQQPTNYLVMWVTLFLFIAAASYVFLV